MPRNLYAAGSPLLIVQEQPPGPQSGSGLRLAIPAGATTLGAREVEDLRDTFTDWLRANGR